MLGAYCWLLWLAPTGGWATFPQFPLTGLKSCWGGTFQSHMAPTLAPEALKELGSFLLAVPSLGPCKSCPWPLLLVVPVPQPNRCAVAEAVCPRPVWPLWELRQPGVLLSIHPLPWPLSLRLFGVLAGLLPCPALVRATINLAIWFPNSVVPSTGSVVRADLALTLSQVSSFLLSPL